MAGLVSYLNLLLLVWLAALNGAAPFRPLRLKFKFER
jgi:hypothetical protein